MSSNFDYNYPPTYAAACPSPDYSRDLCPSERLVESSISPPPYVPHNRISRVTSTASNSSTSSYTDYGTEYGTILASSNSSSSHRATPTDTNSPRPRYVYTSGNVELDLGEREGNHTIPSYGLNGLIRGVVKLKKLSHVQSIVISVCLLGHYRYIVPNALFSWKAAHRRWLCKRDWHPVTAP